MAKKSVNPAKHLRLNPDVAVDFQGELGRRAHARMVAAQRSGNSAAAQRAENVLLRVGDSHPMDLQYRQQRLALGGIKARAEARSAARMAASAARSASAVQKVDSIVNVVSRVSKGAGKLALPLFVAGVAAESYQGYKSGGLKGAAIAGLKSAISPATDALAATPAGEIKKVRTTAPHVQLKALDRVNAVKNFAGNQGMRKLSSAYAKSKAAASATGKQDKANRAGSAVLVKGHYAVSDTGKQYFVKQHMRRNG